MSTGILIETIREVNDNGKPGYRITKIQALTRAKLPELYLAGDQKTAYKDNIIDGGLLRLRTKDGTITSHVYIGGWDGVKHQEFYTCEDMEKINVHIKAAGDHLMEVNAHLRKEREFWQGKVTFVDGVTVKTETMPDKPPKNQPIELTVKIADFVE